MKKGMAVVLSLLLFLAAAVLPPAASAEISMVEVTKGASIRTEPGYNADKIAMAETGSQYLCLGIQGNWYEIQVDAETTGYLPKDSCRLVTAPAVPTGSTQEAFDSIVKMLKNVSGCETALPEAFHGKTVLAVYYDLNSAPEELSTEMLAADGYYWSIPEDLLAKEMTEADWALLIYPTFTGKDDDPIRLNVFAVDVKNSVYYAPYMLDDRVTLLENDETSYELDSTLRGMEEFVIYPRIEKQIRMENDENYQAGLQYFEEGKFYSAYASFRMSDLEEAEEMAQKCAQPWPATEEIWHNASVKGKNMKLTIKANQESDCAILIKIYKGDLLASCMFIGGTGSVSTNLPAGTYTIKQGSGTEWYGLTEAFGADGSYQTMTFGENDEEKIKLEAGYAYTITVNVTDANPEADGVGTTDEEWGSF